MSKKDYELIAAAFRAARPCAVGDRGRDWYDGWHAVVDSVADALASDNPRFDRARFLAACGVTP